MRLPERAGALSVLAQDVRGARGLHALHPRQGHRPRLRQPGQLGQLRVSPPNHAAGLCRRRLRPRL